jgi:hypothetical protein
MANGSNPTETRVLNNIASATDDASLGVPVESVERQPVYKVVGDTKIPVSKHHGKLWESRKKASLSKMENRGLLENWQEAIRYYKNDQRSGEDVKGRNSGNTRSVKVGDENWVETENIVFANTSAMVPSVYAKNPVAEVTSLVPNDDEYAARATQLERVINVLGGKKSNPGINLKPKARKAVIMATLTNIAYVEIGYTFKDQSNDQALQDLDQLAAELSVAKDQQEIETIEGKLEALENKIDFLRPSGPWCKFRHPKDVIRDPDSVEADMSDAKWIMIGDYVSTSFINAQYREEKGNNEHVSIYEPSHIISTNTGNGIDDEINSFSLLNHDQNEYKNYGYDNEDSFKKAQRTKVWYVWDKITRRVYMYSDKDWKWPIWVWDDPYNLDQFFPVYALEFYTDPEDDIAQSEVMYYLDHQDAINQMNAEKAKMRHMAMYNIFYNMNVIKDRNFIEKFMNGTSKSATPVDLPPEADLKKAFTSLLPPSADYLQLFDTKVPKDAAAGISSVMPIMRGEQFKTNTTNDQVETYNSQQQTRLDEKIDAIEDFIGGIYWGIGQLCLQFMTAEEVTGLIGQQAAQGWQNYQPEDIRTAFSCQIVGGSTQKPTSKAKQDAAIKIGQVLGQFAQVPAAILLILKVFERAYDDFTVTEEDWKMIEQSMQGEGANPEQVQKLIQMIQAFDQLPPEAKMALGKATAQGAPIADALPRILEMAQGQGGGEQPTEQPAQNGAAQ